MLLFYQKQPTFSVPSQLDHLRTTLPKTFPLVLPVEGQESRLTTTLEKSETALIVKSKLNPLTRFLRVEGDSQKIKTDFEIRLKKISETVQANKQISLLEGALKTEFDGISLPKIRFDYQHGSIQPIDLERLNSFISTFSSLDSLQFYTSLMEKFSGSHQRLLGLHAQLIALFSKELGVNRKALQ